ncbi:hypothetical protein SNEBB_010634 [Seison nebaliae]|nr:hypothetical protein SNEBB_010634 [Seison nebaliae]
MESTSIYLDDDPISELNMTMDETAALLFMFKQEYYLQIVFRCLSIFLIVIGVGGNAILIFIIGTQKDKRNSTYYCLANLGVADLFYIVVCVPGALMNQNNWNLGIFMCYFSTVMEQLMAHASVFTILVICIERFVAICHPLTISLICTGRRIIRIVTLIWILSMVLSIPYAIETSHTKVSYNHSQFTCKTNSERPWFKYGIIVGENIIFFFIPLIVMVVLNTLVITKLLQRNNCYSHKSSKVLKINTNQAYMMETNQNDKKITTTILSENKRNICNKFNCFNRKSTKYFPKPSKTSIDSIPNNHKNNENNLTLLPEHNSKSPFNRNSQLMRSFVSKRTGDGNSENSYRCNQTPDNGPDIKNRRSLSVDYSKVYDVQIHQLNKNGKYRKISSIRKSIMRKITSQSTQKLSARTTKKIERKRYKNRKQVAMIITFIIIIFIVCIMPMRIIFFLHVLTPQLIKNLLQAYPFHYNLLISCCRLLTYINSCSNPITIIIISSKFRRSVKLIISKFPCFPKLKITSIQQLDIGRSSAQQ